MCADDCRDAESPAPDPLDAFDEFTRAVRSRLEAGRVAYGDRSFSRPPVELVEELRQEALDLAGWGFVLFVRLRALEEAARRATAPRRMTGAERHSP